MLLAIDTSTDNASLALVGGDEASAESTWHCEQNHTVELLPHLARLLVGHDFRRVLVVSIPLGAAFTLYADQAARLLFMPSEIPVGLVTALVGAPLMIYVARRVL